MEDIRYLSMPSTWSSAWISSKKVSPVFLPKSPILTPVITISFPPAEATSSACLIYRTAPAAPSGKRDGTIGAEIITAVLHF